MSLTVLSPILLKYNLWTAYKTKERKHDSWIQSKKTHQEIIRLEFYVKNEFFTNYGYIFWH